jgi:hypothetical protein
LSRRTKRVFPRNANEEFRAIGHEIER